MLFEKLGSLIYFDIMNIFKTFLNIWKLILVVIEQSKFTNSIGVIALSRKPATIFFTLVFYNQTQINIKIISIEVIF